MQDRSPNRRLRPVPRSMVETSSGFGGVAHADAAAFIDATFSTASTAASQALPGSQGSQGSPSGPVAPAVRRKRSLSLPSLLPTSGLSFNAASQSLHSLSSHQPQLHPHLQAQSQASTTATATAAAAAAAAAATATATATSPTHGLGHPHGHGHGLGHGLGERLTGGLSRLLSKKSGLLGNGSATGSSSSGNSNSSASDEVVHQPRKLSAKAIQDAQLNAERLSPAWSLDSDFALLLRPDAADPSLPSSSSSSRSSSPSSDPALIAANASTAAKSPSSPALAAPTPTPTPRAVAARQRSLTRSGLASQWLPPSPPLAPVSTASASASTSTSTSTSAVAQPVVRSSRSRPSLPGFSLLPLAEQQPDLPHNIMTIPTSTQLQSSAPTSAPALLSSSFPPPSNTLAMVSDPSAETSSHSSAFLFDRNRDHADVVDQMRNLRIDAETAVPHTLPSLAPPVSVRHQREQSADSGYASPSRFPSSPGDKAAQSAMLPSPLSSAKPLELE